MYRLRKPLRYGWSFTPTGNFIVPYFDEAGRQKIDLHFVELLDEDGKIKGMWSAGVMARPLVAQICRAIWDAYRDWEELDPDQLQGMFFD